MNNAEIEVRNNLAQAWVQYEAKFGNEAELTKWTGKDLFSFIKFEGEWKIVSIVYESDE